MTTNTNIHPELLTQFMSLVEQLSLLTDRSNFLRQRCSGLGRMECQTLRLLEDFRCSKPELRERIRRQELTEHEVELYVPRTLRSEYEHGELTEAQLEELPRDLSMKALAGMIGVACSRMTRIGDTLADERSARGGRGKGMIHRAPSPDDRRVILIRITEKGSEKVREQEARSREFTTLLLSRIPADQHRKALDGLEHYRAALEAILPLVDPDANERDRDCQE